MHVVGLSRLVKWNLASVIQHPDRYQVFGHGVRWCFQVASLGMIGLYVPAFVAWSCRANVDRQ